MKLSLLYLFLFSLLSTGVVGQQRNTVMVSDTILSKGVPSLELLNSKSKLDPIRSALLSAVLPGMGQVYNQQYWKLPIIYGGAIAFGHFIMYNHDFYNAFRNAYLAETDNDASTVNPYPRFSSKEALELNAKKFKRDRDYLIILSTVFYLLQIVDAHVSSHLIEFDLNDDLSLRPNYHPKEKYFTQNLGMSLILKLHK